VTPREPDGRQPTPDPERIGDAPPARRPVFHVFEEFYRRAQAGFRQPAEAGSDRGR
jgi:hypothetical protein